MKRFWLGKIVLVEFYNFNDNKCSNFKLDIIDKLHNEFSNYWIEAFMEDYLNNLSDHKT